MNITKMTGLGNHFVIVNLFSPEKQPELKNFVTDSALRKKWASYFCNSNFGPGADGIVYVLPTKEESAHFQWDFYNSDGSEAEMCGNAARCVARFAFDNKLSPEKGKFLSLAGLIEYEVQPNWQVKVKMAPAKVVVTDEDLGNALSFSIINTGVPHAVVRLNDFSDKELMLNLVKKLRYPGALGTKGANVSFWFKQDNGVLKSTSFERGVEGFTLACGTGAVACAVDYFLKSTNQQINLKLPGGRLMVNLDSGLKNITMIGAANYIYEAKLHKEWWDGKK